MIKNVHCLWLSEALVQVLQEPNVRRASLVYMHFSPRVTVNAQFM